MKQLFSYWAQLGLVVGLSLGCLAGWAQPSRKADLRRYEVGRLTNGLPVGQWQYFDDVGQSELVYDYDSARIVSARPDTTRYQLQLKDTWQTTRPTRPPRLLGSRAKLLNAWQAALRYPTRVLRAGQNGRVVFSFVVNERGQVAESQVLEASAEALGTEVTRAIGASPLATTRWLPAEYQGRPVASRHQVAVIFTICEGSPACQAASNHQAQQLPPLPLAFNSIIVTAVGLGKGGAGVPLALPADIVFEQGQRNPAGEPTGSWSYLDEAGELELRMTYDPTRISYRRPDTARYELLVGDTWRLVHPDRAPGLLGSSAYRRRTLEKEIHYPAQAIQQQLSGDVIISFVVQPNGHTADYNVVQSLSPACDQEVWRVLKKLPDNWISAFYQGQSRPARYYLSIHFGMFDNMDKFQASTIRTAKVGPYADRIAVNAVFIEVGQRTD